MECNETHNVTCHIIYQQPMNTKERKHKTRNIWKPVISIFCFVRLLVVGELSA